MTRRLFLTFFILLSAFSNCIQAQDKIKEGEIKFDISYPDTAMTPEMISVLPKELIVYFKNGDTRTEMNMGKSIMTMIKYGQTGDLYNLKKIRANKIAVKMSKEYLDKLKDSLLTEKPAIKITDETKNIASFKCTKEIVTVSAKKVKKSFEVWVTKDIVNVDISEYNVPGIDGFPMEFTITSQGITMHMICSSVDKTPIDDSLFKIPDEYKIVTIEEMKKKGLGYHK